MRLAQLIEQTQPASGQIAIFYAAQAGFLVKTSGDRLVGLDLYFSDCCERLYGFKRMIPPVIGPQELNIDLLVSTHAHEDHLDVDALGILAQCGQTSFLGAADCRAAYESAGLANDRHNILSEGEEWNFGDIVFRGIFADHGDSAPQAIGLLISIDGVNIYCVGDTAYVPEKILASLQAPVDIMITPINGAFGNLDHVQACQLAAAVKPKVLLACHFGMFIEHGGDPASFLAQAENLPAAIKAVVMAPGERMMYSCDNGLLDLVTLKVDMEPTA